MSCPCASLGKSFLSSNHGHACFYQSARDFWPSVSKRCTKGDSEPTNLNTLKDKSYCHLWQVGAEMGSLQSNGIFAAGPENQCFGIEGNHKNSSTITLPPPPNPKNEPPLFSLVGEFHILKSASNHEHGPINDQVWFSLRLYKNNGLGLKLAHPHSLPSRHGPCKCYRASGV